MLNVMHGENIYLVLVSLLATAPSPGHFVRLYPPPLLLPRDALLAAVLTLRVTAAAATGAAAAVTAAVAGEPGLVVHVDLVGHGGQLGGDALQNSVPAK